MLVAFEKNLYFFSDNNATLFDSIILFMCFALNTMAQCHFFIRRKIK